MRGGIINGRATNLPKPEYSQEAKDFCAGGEVKVEVLVSEDGKVISARAISGDELLRDSSVEAAKKAKFGQISDLPPVKMKGIVVYNFVPEKKCIVTGIVNKRAQFIPKPIVPKTNHYSGTVKVEIIVEVVTGKVIKARAVSGRSQLRIAAVNSARQATFSPVNDVPPNINVKAILIYEFQPNGKIEY